MTYDSSVGDICVPLISEYDGCQLNIFGLFVGRGRPSGGILGSPDSANPDGCSTSKASHSKLSGRSGEDLP
jgi:hypothetical protein